MVLWLFFPVHLWVHPRSAGLLYTINYSTAAMNISDRAGLSCFLPHAFVSVFISQLRPTPASTHTHTPASSSPSTSDSFLAACEIFMCLLICFLLDLGLFAQSPGVPIHHLSPVRMLGVYWSFFFFVLALIGGY